MECSRKAASKLPTASAAVVQSPWSRNAERVCLCPKRKQLLKDYVHVCSKIAFESIKSFSFRLYGLTMITIYMYRFLSPLYNVSYDILYYIKFGVILRLFVTLQVGCISSTQYSTLQEFR